MFGRRLNPSHSAADLLRMPTITLCERCDAPLDERMNWCAKCRTAPWAPASWAEESIDILDWPKVLDWPSIWEPDRDPVTEPITPVEDYEVPQFADVTDPQASVVWSLRKAISTVALLVGLATMSALFVPERVVGFVSLVSLGTIALLVVWRAWVSEPTGVWVRERTEG